MHICFLDMFHVFSLVCFLIYGVKRGSGGDGSQSFGPILHSKTGLGRFGHVRFQTFCPIWHVSGPKMVF